MPDLNPVDAAAALPPIELMVGWLLGGLLILARVIGALLYVPGLASGQAPVVIRLLFALTLTLILDLGLGGVYVPLPDSPLMLLLLAGREVIIGLALGFAVRLMLAAAEVAGSLAGISMGLSLNVFLDPSTGDQSLALGSMLGMVAALLFVAMDGHRIVILTLFEHLQHVPPAVLTFDAPSAQTLGRLLNHLCVTALTLASPVVVVTLILNIALAFVSRAVPAVNLFGIGLSMLLLAGLLAMGMMGDALILDLDRSLRDLPRDMVLLAGGH